MRRREFLWSGGVLGAAALTGRYAEAAVAIAPPESWHPTQGIDALPERVFRERLSRAAALAEERGWAAILVEPATNFEYLTGASFGRSERLIALLVRTAAEPLIVAPSFEVERVTRTVSPVAEIRGWEEHEDPYRMVADALTSAGEGAIGIEPSVRYGVVARLQQAMPKRAFADADPLFTRMRIVKSAAELDLIRRAVSITEASIAATFASLEPGLTDRDVAGRLSQEMADRGARGGGLVQFGPTSAIPHGGYADRRLEPSTPVLIDAGCRVHGYTSDITRMHFFGDRPLVEYETVFNTVLAAQTAALEAGAPGMECQRLDRIARGVIEEAGYGQYFTHRLGHGMGMDGHEPPYLVEGNRRLLEPGMVFTIEPGIYLPGRWGVRIEDDVVVGEAGLQPLSERVSPL